MQQCKATNPKGSPPMMLRNLGKSEVKISPIGLGCWQFSDSKGMAGKFWPGLDQVPAQDIIKAMLDGGVNWLDTAEAYGWGASEACISRSLQGLGIKPGEVVIATKWHPVIRSAKHLLHSIEERKKFLAPYPIDLHQIHHPSSRASASAEADALAKLIEGGHIRAAGVSNYTAGMMRKEHKALAKLGHPLASNQVQYSILHRNIESNGVMETAKELGITIIAYSPLAQGMATGRFHDNPEAFKSIGFRKFVPMFNKGSLKKSQPVIDALKKYAEKYKSSPAQVALNWLIHFHGNTVVAIPGATKLSQAQQNIGAMTFTLEKDELNHLDEVSRPFK